MNSVFITDRNSVRFLNLVGCDTIKPINKVFEIEIRNTGNYSVVYVNGKYTGHTKQDIAIYKDHESKTILSAQVWHHTENKQ